MKILIGLVAVLTLLNCAGAPANAHAYRHHYRHRYRHVAAVRDTSPVVWVNLNSGVYHYKGERWYGRTENGAYMTEKQAIAHGYRATRNGQ